MTKKELLEENEELKESLAKIRDQIDEIIEDDEADDLEDPEGE